MPTTNPKSPKTPTHHAPKALRLTTYERLEAYLKAFAEGHFHLLILIGGAGLGKSRSVRAALGGSGCWIEGNATPFGMYAKLYRHRDEFVVIDDVDGLYSDRSGVRLLKCLCQTEEAKAVAWHSDARSLERQGIPREFTTKSRVVIISNDWKTLNRNVAALQDCGHVLLFQPSADEVHQKAGTWKGYGNDSRHNGPLSSQILHSEALARTGRDTGRGLNVEVGAGFARPRLGISQKLDRKRS